MRQHTITDVVNKLVGPIRPIGCAVKDEERLDNLNQYLMHADEVIRTIIIMAEDHEDDYRHSVKKAGMAARALLDNIKGALDD